MRGRETRLGCGKGIVLFSGYGPVVVVVVVVLELMAFSFSFLWNVLRSVVWVSYLD